MKKVLVLMASYNGEKYIEEQIESLLQQLNVSISILVRDDGSYDNTIKILEKYSLSGKLKWYTGKHLNVDYSFYNLMQKAEAYDADYFAFCDQDDVWDTDKLSVAINNLEFVSKNIPTLYYCGQRIVDNQLNFIKNHKLNEKRSFFTRFIFSDIAGCTAVFNRNLLEKVLMYRPHYMLMHDTWILKVCLSLGGHVIVDSDPHMDYRQHANNIIGLDSGIGSQIKRIKQYIFEYKIEKQIRELKKGYYNIMSDEYKVLVDYICTYRYDKKSCKRLLDKHYINFHNRGLNIVYNLKIVLKKL